MPPIKLYSISKILQKIGQITPQNACEHKYENKVELCDDIQNCFFSTWNFLW